MYKTSKHNPISICFLVGAWVILLISTALLPDRGALLFTNYVLVAMVMAIIGIGAKSD